MNPAETFAHWSPCVYRGAIVCANCERCHSEPEEDCDMRAGRLLAQGAFEAGFRAAQTTAGRVMDLIATGTTAMEGARVLADCYFEQVQRDSCNSDNYCRMVDWLREARQAQWAWKTR